MTAATENERRTQNSAVVQCESPASNPAVLTLRRTATLLERMLGSLSSDSQPNDPDGPSGEKIHVDMDTAIDLISNGRRREIILQVDDLATGETLAVDALARRLGAIEENCAPDEVSEETLSSITTSLVHRHLTTLAGHDVVEYDRDAQLVRSGESVSGLAQLIVTISAKCAE